jgi:hypothetical protein
VGEILYRCTQCWKHKPAEDFQGVRKERVNWCKGCRVLYRGGGHRATRRSGLSSEELRVGFVRKTMNPKLGPMPTSITSGETCPDACRLKDSGCFAEFGILAMHWREVSETGLSWSSFLERVRSIPKGEVWRHNTAGDLPGVNNRLDVAKLLDLVSANEGRRGFTYTAKPLQTPNELSAVALANHKGFTVNVTAYGLDDLDAKRARSKLPTVVILPHYSDAWATSPGGAKVYVCPNEQDSKVTCASCQLCSRPERKVTIGFLAHGQWRARVDRLVELKVKGKAAS